LDITLPKEQSVLEGEHPFFIRRTYSEILYSIFGNFVHLTYPFVGQQKYSIVTTTVAEILKQEILKNGNYIQYYKKEALTGACPRHPLKVKVGPPEL